MAHSSRPGESGSVLQAGKDLERVKLLESKGVIELHSNPDPRLWFDRTQHYLFLPEKVNAWINERFPANRECIIGKSMMPGERARFS